MILKDAPDLGGQGGRQIPGVPLLQGGMSTVLTPYETLFIS